MRPSSASVAKRSLGGVGGGRRTPVNGFSTSQCHSLTARLDTQYPQIAQRAKAEGAEVHWGDETALVNTDVRGRSFAPKGKTPVALAVGGTRQKLSMIATVTNQGKARWMIIDGAFNHERLIAFLESLVKDTGKKIFLILDNLGVHHCKPVKAWLAQQRADGGVLSAQLQP